MSDTDRLAAETRRLLDAASPGPWRHVPPSQDGTVHRVVTDAGPEFPFGLLRMDDTGYSKRSSYDQRAADAALIAAAPRLLANWLARNEQTEAVEDDLGRIANENAALAGRLMAERDRLADENRALREAIRTHEDLHRPVGPDSPNGPIHMDGWPCCDDDRHLWAAADRGVTDGDRNEGDER